MPFNVNDFRAALQYDGARPNKFEAFLSFPPQVLGSAQASAKAPLMVRSTQLPGRTIGMVPMQYFGREVKIPGDPTFADWTVTIINDEDFIIRNAFENWHNQINGHVSNIRDPSMVNYLGYSVPMQAIQYGKAGNIIKQYDFEGVWPSDVAPIDLDWGTNDAIEEFTVTLSVQYWTSSILVPTTDF